MKAALTLNSSGSAVRGFTLLELMTAVAVASILLGLGIPAFNNMIRDSQIAAESGNLQTTMTLARSEALKRGIRVSVCPPETMDAEDCDPAGDWTKGWIMFTDDFGNPGVIDPSDVVLQVWPAPATGTNIGTAMKAVTFNRSGRAELDGTFGINKAGCINDQKRRMSIDFSGRVGLSRTDCDSADDEAE